MSAACFLVVSGTARGQEQKPPPKPADPTLDQLLDGLSKVDAKQLQEHMAKLETEHKKLIDQAAGLRKQLQTIEAQAAAMKRRIDMLKILVKPASAAQKPAAKTAAAPPKKKDPPPAAQTPKMAAKKPTPPPTGDKKPAEPKMAAKKPVEPPKAKVEQKVAMKPPEAKPTVMAVAAQNPAQAPLLNFEQHVKPIFIENCATCHNPDKSRGGLIVDSHTALLEGGSSGEVVTPGDPDGSRLWLLVNHDETPNMPWKAQKLDDAKLKVIRTWIEQGALADANSKAVVAKQPKPQVLAVAAPIVDGAAPMPNGAPKQLAEQTPRPTAAVAIAASPVAPLIAVCGSGQIVLYNTKTRAIAAALPYPDGNVQRLQFSADGLWLLAAGGIAGKSGVVVLFDVTTGERVAEVGRQYDAVLAAAIDPYRELVAAGGSNRVVRVHDLLTDSVSFEIKKHNDWITATAFSPDATLLATGDRAGGLFVWEAETGRLVHTLRGHAGAIQDLAFRPDSAVLASTGDDGTARLWEMENGKQIKRFNAHSTASLSVDFAPDGRICTSGADQLLKLWKPGGGALRTFEALGDWVYSARFVDQGTSVIAGTWAGQIHVFNAESGERIWRFDTNPKPDAEVARGE